MFKGSLNSKLGIKSKSTHFYGSISQICLKRLIFAVKIKAVGEVSGGGGGRLITWGGCACGAWGCACVWTSCGKWGTRTGARRRTRSAGDGWGCGGVRTSCRSADTRTRPPSPLPPPQSATSRTHAEAPPGSAPPPSTPPPASAPTPTESWNTGRQRRRLQNAHISLRSTALHNCVHDCEGVALNSRI
jgi:hypothetical protein